jgi:hypothetical protein
MCSALSPSRSTSPEISPDILRCVLLPKTSVVEMSKDGKLADSCEVCRKRSCAPPLLLLSSLGYVRLVLVIVKHIDSIRTLNEKSNQPNAALFCSLYFNVSLNKHLTSSDREERICY